ncbi:hypothetical protein IEQ34_019915 [Dendrobium chrysotoxum]|uniref:Legumain prodomain domain-containing protein n=1 Tax=Dendrobium chrysotoxum TaxID=161865 RepID=A0AAV7G8T0_DENCH|nr:hypothetical protein IEQ34_019915 [Dendrobium chrysotoxum]
MTNRMHVDRSINLIGKLLFGSEKGIQVLSAVRQTGQPLVDNWACLKSMVRTFETHCGSLSQYGMKHMCSIANICNAGISKEKMAKVSAEVCNQIPSTPWSSLHRGFTMASIRSQAVALFSIAAICVSLLSLLSFHPVLRLPSEISGRRLEAGGDDSVGTRWAILIAGSSGYGNYRHQGDNCLPFTPNNVNQRDADLVYYWHEFINSPEGSSKKLDAQDELLDILTHRKHVDNSVNHIGKLLFGSEKYIQVLSAVRPRGQPLVDNWACLKSTVRIFETHCGSLSQYGIKHMLSFANICNAGISNETMAKVSAKVCIQIPSIRRSSLPRGFNV